MSPGNAERLARATNTDSAVLHSIAHKQQSGETLTASEGDAFARWDLIVTAMLDEVYQRADQAYKNATRALAMVIAILLTLTRNYLLYGPNADKNIGKAIFIGLLATPIAPIAKDL